MLSDVRQCTGKPLYGFRSIITLRNVEGLSRAFSSVLEGCLLSVYNQGKYTPVSSAAFIMVFSSSVQGIAERSAPVISA